MSVLPSSVEQVINEFSRLPGVGPKSASRMAYHYLRSPNKDATKLASALEEMDREVKNCKSCFNVTDKEECSICSSQLRKKDKLCVVEEPLDVVAFENSGVYDGLYFVLGGVISPAEGIGEEELRFKELEKRVKELLEDIKEGSILEIIVATNPSLEGEATSSYIIDLFKTYLKEKRIKITRLAMGLPTGADLEYADRLTLKRALEGRTDI
ncbi:MAG: recombination mediator RecR [Candidatus Dojkabacteria bacterium]|nr:recombination mediator RecR [Candidatus Dojkabacteria bacterium]MDD4560857.1 recombination mediator RecR [Candidatus Dojkabacteria bacterium]